MKYRIAFKQKNIGLGLVIGRITENEFIIKDVNREYYICAFLFDFKKNNIFYHIGSKTTFCTFNKNLIKIL